MIQTKEGKKQPKTLLFWKLPCVYLVDGVGGCCLHIPIQHSMYKLVEPRPFVLSQPLLDHLSDVYHVLAIEGLQCKCKDK
jgi:hypothetical protein